MENPLNSLSYAGFWRRLVAYLIDTAILSVVALIIMVPTVLLLGLGAAATETESGEPGPGLALGILIALLGVGLVLLLNWLYFALMESSSKGATLGKMAIGIRVTDLQGRRISFGRATGRYFAKLFSSLIFGLGYLMAAFTQQKQALHDMVAACLVTKP